MHTAKKDSFEIDPRATGRLPALDGLRGVAIVGVMMLHMAVLKPHNAVDRAASLVFSNGGVGVDLFFVLSGFLITGILLDTSRDAGYFRNFYARRFLRVVPLYLGLLFIAFVVFPIVPIRVVQKIVDANVSPWPYLTFTSNLAIAAAGRFRNPVLDVSWSLSIEEQFYLIWPVIVMALKPRGVVVVSAVLIVVCLSLRCASAWCGRPATEVEFATWNRWDGLSIGALIAAACRCGGGLDQLWRVMRVAAPAAAIAAALILALVHAPDPGVNGYALRRGPTNTLVVIAAAGLLTLLLVAPRGIAGRITALPVLRMLGRFSFAIYLINLPIRAALRDTLRPERWPLVFGSNTPAQIVFIVLSAASCVAVAFVIWHGFEKHFLTLRRRFETPHTACSRRRRDAASPTELRIGRDRAGLEV